MNDDNDDQLEMEIMMRNIWNWYHTENCGRCRGRERGRKRNVFVQNFVCACDFLHLIWASAGNFLYFFLYIGHTFQAMQRNACLFLWPSYIVHRRLSMEYVHFIKRPVWFIRCLWGLNWKMAFVSIPLFSCCDTCSSTLIIILHNAFLDLKSDTWRIFSGCFTPFFMDHRD